MGASKDFWMEEVGRATEDFAFERIARDQALNRLSRLGFPEGEAEILLDEAVS